MGGAVLMSKSKADVTLDKGPRKVVVVGLGTGGLFSSRAAQRMDSARARCDWC